MNTKLEFIRLISEIFELENRDLHPVLGKVGFELPDLSKLKMVPANELNNIENLIINGVGINQNNWIFLPHDFKLFAPLRITFSGNARGNVIVFDIGTQPFGLITCHGKNGLSIFSGPFVGQSHFELIMSNSNNTFYWGRNSSSNGLSVFIAGDNKSAIFGSETMVARKVNVLTSDMHPIVDTETSQWFNEPQDVVIEPHVWLGLESIILRGVEIGFGSIIATRAVVTKSVPRQSLSGGIPAKTIRKNVTWFRPGVPSQKLIDEFNAFKSNFIQSI